MHFCCGGNVQFCLSKRIQAYIRRNVQLGIPFFIINLMKFHFALRGHFYVGYTPISR
jgi:hypothetical protein